MKGAGGAKGVGGYRWRRGGGQKVVRQGTHVVARGHEEGYAGTGGQQRVGHAELS